VLITHHIAALALVAADVVVRAVRIRLLVPHSSLSLWRAITINAYGDAASAITPGRLGGDPARFWGFRRAGIDTPRALAGLGVEALIDWVLLGVATVGLGLIFAETAAGGLRRLVALATGPEARLLVVAVLVLVAASAAAVRWYRRRSPPGAGSHLSLRATWQCARQLGWRTLAIAAALTAISMVARTAILPVLVAGHSGLATGAVIVGSFALLYGQLALPTPAGAGGVELGFVGGFAGALSTGELATLLIVWRIYTLILGAALGALLFARAAPGGWGWWRRRRYRLSNSVNVRSQL
jgi:uncharacterized membrane protein YbhN (UPF0104 family)